MGSQKFGVTSKFYATYIYGKIIEDEVKHVCVGGTYYVHMRKLHFTTVIRVWILNWHSVLN